MLTGAEIEWLESKFRALHDELKSVRDELHAVRDQLSGQPSQPEERPVNNGHVICKHKTTIN